MKSCQIEPYDMCIEHRCQKDRIKRDNRRKTTRLVCPQCEYERKQRWDRNHGVKPIDIYRTEQSEKALKRIEQCRDCGKEFIPVLEKSKKLDLCKSCAVIRIKKHWSLFKEINRSQLCDECHTVHGRRAYAACARAMWRAWLTTAPSEWKAAWKEARKDKRKWTEVGNIRERRHIDNISPRYIKNKLRTQGYFHITEELVALKRDQLEAERIYRRSKEVVK